MRTSLVSLAMASLASAFSLTPRFTSVTTMRDTRSSLGKPTTVLSMSDVPTDDDDWKDVLPPSPEDQLVMTGDIVALFVYSFMDHEMNELIVQQAQRGTPPQILDPLGELPATQLPVWFDAVHSTLSEKSLLTILGMPDIHYSPLIATAGAASVILTASWLLSGWFSGAFLFRNTLECQPERALVVTFKTWMVTTIIMVLLSLGSHWIVGDPSVSLTKADADYIFDSLTVLVIWRFMVNAMLGYGK